MFLNSACTFCLGLEPVPTSEYLTLCRPTLQHSGRGRPVSVFPKCVHGVQIVAFEIKALSVQQRTAFHQARSGCQACWPFRTRRGGGNGHGTAFVPPNSPAKGQGASAVDVSHSSVVVILKQTKKLYEPQT